KSGRKLGQAHSAFNSTGAVSALPPAFAGSGVNANGLTPPASPAAPDFKLHSVAVSSAGGWQPSGLHGGSDQLAASLTGTTAVPSSTAFSFISENSKVSPANSVPSRIVPRWNGPSPSTHVSRAELAAWTMPDCQTGRPVNRLYANTPILATPFWSVFLA